MKDTVGAGDCFVGTFAYLLADYIDSTSKPIDFSTLCTFVQRSCYASSYSVQFSGGFDKYPTEIIEECGLLSPFEDGNIEKIVKELEKMID